MTNQQTSQTKSISLIRLGIPLMVYLLSNASRLINVIPVWQGQPRDDATAGLFITGTLVQALMDLPAVAMFIYLRMYREWKSSLRQHLIGSGVGVALAVVVTGIKFFLAGADEIVFMRTVPAFTQSLNLDSPWNLIGAVAALLAYGPGEAVANTAKMIPIGVIFGMALRGSRSWIAPVIFWTLTNGTP